MKPTEEEKTDLPGSRIKVLLNNHPSISVLYFEFAEAIPSGLYITADALHWYTEQVDVWGGGGKG